MFSQYTLHWHNFSEPGEMLTYCFAIAIWHLIGETEVGVIISVCTRNHSDPEPALSLFSHGLLVLPQKDIYMKLKNAINPPLSTSLFYLNEQAALKPWVIRAT